MTSQIALFVSSNALFISGSSAYKLLHGHHGNVGDETGAAQTRIIGGDEANTGEYPPTRYLYLFLRKNTSAVAA